MVQNAGKGGFRAPRPEKPKEQIEYEEATKNIKVLTTKLRLSQQGIDTSSISRQDLDRIMAMYDKMDVISADVRNKTAEIQRESNIEIQKTNQRANEKYSQVSKDIDVLINKMKKVEKTAVDKVAIDQPVEQVQVQGETKGDIRQEINPDKLKEEMIDTFTERIIQKVKKEVINAFEDYASMHQVKVVPQVVTPATVVPQVTVEHKVVPQVVTPTTVVPQITVEHKVVPQSSVVQDTTYEKAGVSIEKIEEQEKVLTEQITIGKGAKVSDKVEEGLVDVAKKMNEESAKVE